MTESRPSPMTPILGLAGLLGIVVLLAAGERLTGLHLAGPVEVTILLGVMAGAAWLACLYWRRIDEAAKAAQKTAYFWGASLGAGVGIAADALLGKPYGAGFANWITALAPQVSPLVIGGLVVVLIQTAGFTVAWALWWKAKR